MVTLKQTTIIAHSTDTLLHRGNHNLRTRRARLHAISFTVLAARLFSVLYLHALLACSTTMCQWQNVKYEVCGHEAKVPRYCKHAPVVSKLFMLSGTVPFTAWGHQTCLDWENNESDDNKRLASPAPQPGSCVECRHWFEDTEIVPEPYSPARAAEVKEERDGVDEDVGPV